MTFGPDEQVRTPSLWIKRWAVLWSAGFALGVTVFFGSFACRAWRIAGLSSSQRVEQAQAMLRYVGDQLRNHDGAQEFEKHFPEAGVVAYVIYGQALVNVGLAEPATPIERARLAEEVRWCLDRLSKERVLETFPDTQVPHGLFLLSRRTLLLAGLHLISDSLPYELTDEYDDNCRAMADAFGSSPYGLVDSFPGFCWPVDNLAALRCLRLHDEKFGTDYSRAVEKWKRWAKGALDSRTGTLPFQVNSQTGEALSPPRGSSLAMSLIELRDVDQEMFQEQYLGFQRHFGDSFLGLTTWREFPGGIGAESDLDTGPVIHGHGVLATLTGMIAAKLAGDIATFCDQMGLIEAIGLPRTRGETRRYLRGRTLILDAVAAYAMAAVPWSGRAGRIARLSTLPRTPWVFLAALMAVPMLTIATAALRSWRIVRRLRPLSLWRSASPTSEAVILFWGQALVLISIFFSLFWFPVIWAGFGIAARGGPYVVRLIKHAQSP